MRVRAHILTTALLAGVAATQTAPASQTVKENPPQSQVHQARKTTSATKMTTKSPFAPKVKPSEAPSQTSAKPRPAAQPSVKKSGTGQTAPPQAKAASKQAAPGVAKTAPKPAVSSPAKALPNAAPKPAVPAQAKNAKQTVPVQAKVAPKQTPAAEAKAPPKSASTTAVPVKTEAATEVAESKPVKLPNPGKRDPFLSPLAAAGMKGPGANCSTGKKCLVVDQIVLKGIVQMQAGNLALVENIARRPYVLHENDALYNGSVVKITGDSVIFREQSSDILGRPVSKEVVKKVSAPAV